MNGKWQYFLNSFATVGGNLFLLVFFVLILLGLVLHILHHGDTNQVGTVVLTTFAAYSGALLQALRGRTTDTNPLPGGTVASSTVTQTTSSAAPKP